MVHALREARRVLKADGILIDLRPATQHSRIGILRAGRFTDLARTCGSLDGERAASRALARVLAGGTLREVSRFRFESDVVFSSVHALREWLIEFEDEEDGPAQKRAVQRVEIAAHRGRCKIAVRVRLALRALKKRGADPRHRARRPGRPGTRASSGRHPRLAVA